MGASHSEFPSSVRRNTVQPDHAPTGVPEFERGLRPRNLFSGGMFERGAEPPFEYPNRP